MFLAKASSEANPEILSAIGRVVIESSRLEYELALIVSHLIDSTDEKVGWIVTAGASIKTLSPLLLSLYEYRVKDENKIEHLKELLGKCQKLSSVRDVYVHSAWISHHPLDSALRQKATNKLKKGFNAKVEFVPASDINKLADEISEIIEKIWTVFLEWMEQNRTTA